MSKSKDKEKTNVMRVLDSLKIPYESFNYVESGVVSGIEVAAVLGQNPDYVFKTLVTVGVSKTYYVFLVPVKKELDLKKAAKAVKEKKIEMLPSKELLSLTGYVHGGCSPIGMKKQFKTIVDRSADSLEVLLFSGGKIGYQIQITIENFKKAVPFILEDITVE